MQINGYELELTCGACPEQYDVQKDGTPVAYLRLRHGSFTAQCPGPSGPVVYHAEPEGDGLFEEHEREHFLKEAIAAVDKHITGEAQ